MLSDWSWYFSWEWTWTTITTTSWNNLSSIAGNNKAMFAPIWTVNNSSYNTYYSDYVYVNTTSLAYAGGWPYGGADAGAFLLDVRSHVSYASSDVGARLMYL